MVRIRELTVTPKDTVKTINKLVLFLRDHNQWQGNLEHGGNIRPNYTA